MVRGLLSEVPSKSMWQLAEFAGHVSPDRLQGFLAKAAWDADELHDRVRAYAVAALAADDAVLIADETGASPPAPAPRPSASHGPNSQTRNATALALGPV
ncbi:transposase [Streptomyces sp. NPDC013178]|uniref:transposase n=1 Tax=Streptomyces sp. NPDC013178 TaxID=3155118 RepID=UPI0033E709D9